VTIWWMYALECSDSSIYTGITNDIDRRVKQHNAGTASKYTRSRRPVKLAAMWKCYDKGEALSNEAAFKKLSRKEKLQRIEEAQLAARPTLVSPIPP